MKFIRYSIIYLIAFLIENNLINLISINNVTPDIVLIFLIFVSLKESQITATLVGFSAGLFQDLFTLSLLGLASLSKALACFVTSFFRRPKGGYSLVYLATIFFTVTIIHDRIYQFIFLLGTNQQFLRSFFYNTLPKAIYTTAIALIINFIFHKIIWQNNEF